MELKCSFFVTVTFLISIVAVSKSVKTFGFYPASSNNDCSKKCNSRDIRYCLQSEWDSTSRVCKTFYRVPECESDADCNNQGTCEVTGGTRSCSCFLFFEGTFCETHAATYTSGDLVGSSSGVLSSFTGKTPITYIGGCRLGVLDSITIAEPTQNAAQFGHNCVSESFTLTGNQVGWVEITAYQCLLEELLHICDPSFTRDDGTIDTFDTGLAHVDGPYVSTAPSGCYFAGFDEVYVNNVDILTTWKPLWICPLS